MKQRLRYSYASFAIVCMLTRRRRRAGRARVAWRAGGVRHQAVGAAAQCKARATGPETGTLGGRGDGAADSRRRQRVRVRVGTAIGAARRGPTSSGAIEHRHMRNGDGGRASGGDDRR
jgi:hypothetical protein